MKSGARFLIGFWLIAAGGVGSPAPCAADTPVGLHPSVEIHRGVVRLSDLFTNVPEYIDTDIAQAPPTGKPATYDSNVLTQLAERYGLDWHSTNPSDKVIVTGLYSHINEDTIRKAVIQKFKDSGARADDFDVSFDNKKVDFDVPADRSTEVAINNFQYDALSKRFRAELTAEGGQGPVTEPLNGRITSKLRVPVLMHRLESGTIVSSNDLDWILVPEDRINDLVITSAEQVIGHELRRSTVDGDLLHTGDVMPPRLVSRGSLVTLKIQTQFMTLTSQGKALQDGTQGDTVRVLNTQSNRMVEGTVDGAGTVVIAIAQKFAVAQ